MSDVLFLLGSRPVTAGEVLLAKPTAPARIASR